ncbi:MAG: MFS transporter [Novosphingobium sp.]|nr:MFS transporter [Novosphingobium sp.]
MGEDRPGRRPDGEFGADLPAVLVVCALVYLLDGLVHSIMGPIAPAVETSLSLSHAELGPIFSANLIGQLFGLILFPLLASKIGNRKVVIVTATGFGVFQVASGFAGTGNLLFATRLMTGVFLGGALPTCLAMVSAVAPPHRRGLVITALFTGYGMGATIAGLVVGIFGVGSWRAAMIAIGACCLATAVLAWLWLGRRSPEAGPDRSEGIGGTLNPLAVLAPRLLVGTLALWLLFICMLTISYCLFSWLPILLVDVGYDPSIAAISVTTFSFGGIVAALGVGLLIDRFGALPVLIGFLVISTVMLFGIGQILASASPATLLILLGVCGFFLLGAYGGVNVVLASHYPEAIRAIGIGWTKSVGRVGTILAPILIGFALSNGVSETTVMSLFALPAGLATFALVIIGLTERRERPAALTAAE